MKRQGTPKQASSNPAKKSRLNAAKSLKQNKIPVCKFALLVVFAVLLSVTATIIVYNSVNIVEVQKYGYDFTISEKKAIGFNAGTDAFHFGKIPAGGFSQRYLNVTNNYGRPLKVIFKFSGKCSEWLHASENKAVLESNTTKEWAITASIPKNARPSNCAGTVTIIFTKTKLAT